MKPITKKQRGFTLVKVMLLSTMASVVVFGGLQDTIVQERLTGNFQKDLNARLLAEKGVFESAQVLKESISENEHITIEELLTVHRELSGVGIIDKQDAKFKALLSNPSDNIIEISSHGFRYGHNDQNYNYEANSYLVAQFEYTPSVSESPFSNAVTGCKGVNLTGSGLVDSYDSSKGSYEDTKADNGNVNTVVGDSDVVINGHSPIRGDVKASGVVYLKGSSPVIGDVHSNTGVDISSGGGIRVKGNVLSRGFVMHRGGNIEGYVRARGDVTMNWGSDILNTRVPGELDIRYGGAGTFPTGSSFEQNGVPYSDELYQFDPTQEEVVAPVDVYDPSNPDYDPENPDKECDPLALPLNMSNVMGDTRDYSDFIIGAQQAYTFTPQQGYFTKNRQGALPWLSKEHEIYIFDKTKQVHGYDNIESEYAFGMKNFSLGSDGHITIDAGPNGGDVIWLIDGDFTMSGNSRLTIKKDSTLTVFVTGKVSLGASAKVISEKEGLAKTGHIVLSIYSSYSQADGVVIKGATDMYAAIYSPLTSIQLSGSGQLFGSVRGAVINSSGGSGVHFDEVIKHINIGTGQTGNTGKLEFKGWLFRHPEPLVNVIEPANTH